MTIDKQFPKESGHWYAKDGTPAYEQPCKSRPGEMRPTTLRDARTLDLVPSVTTILRVAAQPGLERWKQQSLLHAALTLPRIEGETEDAFASRALEDAAQQSRKAREKGTEIHEAIERAMRDGFTTPEMYPFTNAAFQAMGQAEIESTGTPEHSFASPMGFGGKTDLVGENHIIDFKTKADWTDADVKRGLAYDEHGMQLAAYARGLARPYHRLINVFIATDSPGKFHVHEWNKDDHERLWAQFECLLRYWQLFNGMTTDYRARLVAGQTERDVARLDATQAREELAKAEHRITTLSRIKDAWTRRAEAAEHEVVTLRTDLSQREQELREARAENAKLRTENGVMAERLGDIARITKDYQPKI